MKKVTNFNSYDQYYTIPSMAERIIKIVDDICNLNSFDLIIEPSAG